MNEFHLAARLERGRTVVRDAWKAWLAGARAIPFGDNGNLYRDLAEHMAASRRRT